MLQTIEGPVKSVANGIITIGIRYQDISRHRIVIGGTGQGFVMCRA